MALVMSDCFDMDEAAQQLLQLSDEDKNCCYYQKKKKKKKFDKMNNHPMGNDKDDKEDSSDRSFISKMIIEEIFGKEEEREEFEVDGKVSPSVTRKRKRKYGSLKGIYLTTKPLKDKLGVCFHSSA